MKKIETKCPICGETHIFEVTDEQYNKYIAGEEFIQNIFPEMSVIGREMLITGICGECWDKIFPRDEE